MQLGATPEAKPVTLMAATKGGVLQGDWRFGRVAVGGIANYGHGEPGIPHEMYAVSIHGGNHIYTSLQASHLLLF